MLAQASGQIITQIWLLWGRRRLTGLGREKRRLLKGISLPLCVGRSLIIHSQPTRYSLVNKASMLYDIKGSSLNPLAWVNTQWRCVLISQTISENRAPGHFLYGHNSDFSLGWTQNVSARGLAATNRVLGWGQEHVTIAAARTIPMVGIIPWVLTLQAHQTSILPASRGPWTQSNALSSLSSVPFKEIWAKGLNYLILIPQLQRDWVQKLKFNPVSHTNCFLLTFLLAFLSSLLSPPPPPFSSPHSPLSISMELT